MKKIFYFIAALVLVSAVSCVKEEAPVAPSTGSMTVTLGFDGEDTKASFSDKWGITWYVGSTVKWKVDGVLKTHTVTESEFNNGENTVTFAAEGLKPGDKIWVNSDSPVYESYIQSNPGNAEWNRIFLAGTVAEAGEVTKMKIVGSILRFIPYANDEAAKAESVKSVTIEGLDKDYTVTLKDGKELSLAEITSKAQSKSIFLPLAAAEYDSFKVTVNTLAGNKYSFTSGTGKKLVLNENEVVNMSLPLDASHKVAVYSVTFDTDGGSAVTAQNVFAGETVSVPVGVTKDYAGSLSEGLYLGVQDPDDVSYTLEGWYTDAEKTQKYDFSTPVTGSLTLYAKWVSPEAIDLSDFSLDNNLLKAYAYINSLSLSEMTDYTFVLASNIDMWGGEFNLNKDNVRLTLVGAGQERILKRGGNGNFFSCNKGVLILGKNITITGFPSAFKTYPALNINGTAQVIMQTGSKISEITGCTSKGIIILNSGDNKFTIDGGIIENNTINASDEVGIIHMCWGSTLVMNAGSISNNTVINKADKITVGGVYAKESYAKIIKTGGVISGNTATINLDGGAEPTAKVAQQVLYKGTVYNNDLSETDNI